MIYEKLDFVIRFVGAVFANEAGEEGAQTNMFHRMNNHNVFWQYCSSTGKQGPSLL